MIAAGHGIRPPGQPEQDDLRRGHGAPGETLADVGRVGARMWVVLFAAIHVVVIVLLEQHLGGVAGKRHARLKGVRLGDFLDAFQVSVVVGEREGLLGAVGTDGRDPDMVGAGQTGLAPDPPARRNALLKDLDRQRAARERDHLRPVMVMMVVIVLFVLLAPCAPDHPGGDADDDDGGGQLQVRFAALAREVLAEMETEERHRPYDRSVGGRRRQAEQDRLEDGAADSDDKGGHHRLGMAGLKPVQRAEQDGAGDEQPCVCAALLEQGSQVGHAVHFK